MFRNKFYLHLILHFLLAVTLIFLKGPATFAQANVHTTNKNLLIVVDGLALYYVMDEFMPNLTALSRKGGYGESSSAVFPSVTRVASASISTGSYPARHGIIHNDMWMPQMETFSTGSIDNLKELDQQTNGKVLTSISAGEVMEKAGRVFFVCGSGGSGNEFLQNPRGAGNGIWSHKGSGNFSTGFFMPNTEKEKAINAIGELPESESEATVWAVDAYLHHALEENAPDFTLMWITELDHAEHVHKPGSPEALEAASHIDEQIGKILKVHKNRGMQVNIFVTGDHGFSTGGGSYNLGKILKEADLEDKVIRVKNMIYLKAKSQDLLEKVVETLQRNEQVGSIYTRPVRPGSSIGVVPGTISTSAIQWDHPRSADILITPDWNNDVNAFGFQGITTRGGNGAHGGDNPYEIRIPLIAAGPDIKEGIRSEVPTGNVDFIPTILYLQGITPPESMDGRILHELLKGGPAPETVPVHENKQQAAVTFPDGFRYQLELKSFQVGSTFYLQGAKAVRSWD